MNDRADHFQYDSAAQMIVFGAGALADLPAAIDRFGWRRLLICTSPSYVRNAAVARLENVLGERVAGIFADVQPHVQAPQVAAAAGTALELEIDAIVGLGAGSSIGMAKAISMELERRRYSGALPSAQPGQAAHAPAVAVPTTYAGSEMTPVVGITEPAAQPGAAPRKVTRTDPRITPRLVMYDPELTLDLPPAITAATGINALAHAVEALYSITRNPLSSAAAEKAIGNIYRALPICYAHGENIEARTAMLAGAHLAGAALATVKMAIHHGTCHALGGALGVPHALAHSIMLPHAMRFNRTACAPALALVARMLGVDTEQLDEPTAAALAADRVAALTVELELPQRLRDARVHESDLPRVAAQMLHSQAVRDNPRPVNDIESAMQLLRAAW